MVGKPFSIQAPEEIAKEYGGNKQRIAQAVQAGLLDPTSAVLAGMFIDRMRGAQAEEARPVQTVAQQVMAPPAPMAPSAPPSSPAPPAGGLGALAPGMAAGGYARGDLTSLSIPDTMFDEPSNGGFNDGYAGGGIVAFADGGGYASSADDTGGRRLRVGPPRWTSPEEEAAEERARQEFISQGKVGPELERAMQIWRDQQVPEGPSARERLSAAFKEQMQGYKIPEGAKTYGPFYSSRKAPVETSAAAETPGLLDSLKAFGSTPGMQYLFRGATGGPEPSAAADISPAFQTGQEVPLFGPGTTLEYFGISPEKQVRFLAEKMRVNAVQQRQDALATNSNVRFFGGGKILPVPEVQDIDFYRKAAATAIAAQNAPTPTATPDAASALGARLREQFATPNIPSDVVTAPGVSAPPRAPVAGAGLGALQAAQNAPTPTPIPVGGLGATAAAAPNTKDMDSQLASSYEQIGKFMGPTETPEMKAYKEYLAGIPTQMEKQREQDKWMALAQLGASLASSKSPYFLQALGEAGTKAIPAIAEASKERQKTQREAMLAQAEASFREQGLKGAQLDRALQMTNIASQRAIQQQQMNIEERKIGIESKKIAEQLGIEKQRLDLLKDKIEVNPNAAYLDAIRLARDPNPAKAAQGKQELEAVTQLIKLLHPSGSNATTSAQAVAAAIRGEGGASASSRDIPFDALQ
jgi:hypothetical protein